jgi:hypothetical protein
MTSLYETRFLAYIDILGWSEACTVDSPRLAEAAEVLHGEAYHQSRRYRDELEKEMPGRVNPLYLKVEIGAFSDNFVMSKPVDLGDRIFSISATCRRLLKLGFLTRGAVTMGQVHHRDNVVFGPALIEAVALEKEAVYPRILCSEGVLEHFKRVGLAHGTTPIVQDQLGRHIVNLFDPSIMHEEISVANLLAEDWQLGSILHGISDNIAAFSAAGESKKMEKWRYMMDAIAIMGAATKKGLGIP